MTALGIALREIRHRRIHALLFVLTLALGGSAVLSVETMSRGLQTYAMANARELSGGDISVEADETTLDHIEAIASREGHRTARTLETLTMAVTGPETAARVSLKAVSKSYPLAGSVTLTGGGLLALEKNEVALAPRLLIDLGIAPGDSIQIGRASFIVKDTIKKRSDAAFSFFEIAPVIFIRLEDLPQTELMTVGSRAREKLSIVMTSGAPEFAEIIRGDFEGRAAVTEAGDGSGSFRSLQNTLLFLRALGVMTLLVACITIATTVAGAIGDALPSLSAIRAIGASDRTLIGIWLWWSGLLGIAGVGGAIGLGHLLTATMIAHYGDLFPEAVILDSTTEFGPILLILIAALLAAAWPVRQLARISPAALLRPGFDLPMHGTITGVVLLAGTLPFAVALRLDAITAVQSLTTMASTGTFILLARGFLYLFHFLSGNRRNLAVRLAAAGWRTHTRGSAGLRGAAYLSAGLAYTMILSTLLLESNLNDHFIKSYPVDAPNVIFANIRPDQIDRVRAAAPSLSDLYPLIRGRVVSINGISASEIEREITAAKPRILGGGDRITREFGFTYGSQLPETDRIIEGDGLWSDAAGPQVSIHSGFGDRYGIHPGDRISVNVMGKIFDVTVSSVRKIDRMARRPFFYFIFQPGVLEKAPHTFMGSAHLDAASTSILEKRLAADAPNVTVFDIRDAVATADLLLGRLGSAARVIGWITAACGALFLTASVLVEIPRLTRTAAILRALGAGPKRIIALALAEQAVGAIGSMIVAIVVAEGLVWTLLHYAMDLPLLPAPALMGLVAISGIIGMLAVTFLAMRPAWNMPPWDSLRYE